MTELVIMRGLPASGKTTWALAWVAEAPEERARVNRDDLRRMLYGRDAPLPHALEDALTAAQRSAVRALLESGRSVVVDDTHLRARYVRAWDRFASDVDVDLVVWDEFLLVDRDECVRRDRARAAEGQRAVGEDVIKRLTSLIENVQVEPRDPYRYEPNLDARPAWIFDLDGTLALMDGRGPYDWARVGEDLPHEAVANALVGLTTNAGQAACVVLSGRDGSCRAVTEEWLERNGMPVDELIMRPAGDQRRDSLVKLEMFREQVAPYYRVLGVFDDRDQVVSMWRRIGLTCFQVAPGDF